jgi:hypothetical protein
MNDPSRGTAMSDSDLIDSSPPGSPRPASELISHDAIAGAAEHRIQQEMPLARPAQIAAEHDKRQAFRRLVDPGIMRPNAYETAMASLKVSSVLLIRLEEFMLVLLRLCQRSPRTCYVNPTTPSSRDSKQPTPASNDISWIQKGL